MKTFVVLMGIVCSFAAQAVTGADIPAASCADIRLRIAAQTGVLPKPDTAMLQILGARPECRFTATEVYRAAYGDRPMPNNGHRRQRHRAKHHDDDD